MRDTAEIATLRTMLKKVNVEYSTALRGTDHDAKPLKLDALRKQRLALMYRIAALRQRQSVYALPAWNAVADSPQYGWLSGFLRAAQAVTTTGQRRLAGWLGGRPPGATTVPTE